MSINVVDKCRKVVYNDFNTNVVELVKLFKEQKPEVLNDYFNSVIEKYGFRTCSVKSDESYLAMEDGYLKFREYYNEQEERDYKDLYLLSCYSINHLIRFNSSNKFNVSVCKNSYSEKVYALIVNAFKKLTSVEVLNKNIFDIDFNSITDKDFVYLDPPYLNTEAVYNEKRAFGNWSIEDDYKLFDIIDTLNSRGIRFGMSNVYENKGKKNEHLKEWAEKNGYFVHHLVRGYSVFGKESGVSDEVYITNVPNYRQEKLF